ncbi:hypothetical protein vBAmePPT11V19_00023 [Alteromonas phage vB_AmeP_PT11-V19]|nr:hypothetical protein vBAmePPT11V19_00023 [Alteromonas phage vB_AmeP_PT11-V19]
MKSRKEVLEFINKAIALENGQPVTSSSKLSDSGLDSLGLTLFVEELDEEYGLLKNNPDYLGLLDISVDTLITKCKAAYMEKNVESAPESISS